MQPVFKYLNEQEEAKPGFWFQHGNNNGLIISFPGYRHMDLFEVRDALQLTYKLRFDFEKGMEEWDEQSGRTYCYFRDVYTPEGGE